MTAAPDTPATPPPSLQERWPQILRYPLQPEALSTIVALAIAHGAVQLLPALLAGVLDLFVWAAFFRYGFEVLRWTANGRDKAPEISLTVSDAIGGYAVLLLLLVEATIALIAAWYSPIAAAIVGLLATLAMPAMMMILALEEGAARALNPIAWLLIAERVGRPYFVLVGFFCAALIVQSVFAVAIASVLPGILVVPLMYLVVNYLMIANFHMIGQAIHDHRNELGYTGHLELSDEVPWTDPSRTMLDAARNRAASGDIRGAATLLREEILAHPHLLPLHDEYRHWLRADDDKGALVIHGKSHVPVLLAQNQEHRAIEVARECLTLDPTFALDDAGDTTRLAHAAAEAGQTRTALSLVAGFHKRFRNHPDIARNYMLAARLWAERMNKEMQARAMLQQIKLTLPDDAVIPQVDAYLAFLDKLAATPAKAVMDRPAP
ncbi:MAG: hypothetical protein P4L92_15375 [Rudaea sp.]|nr:hypothetical protein [Rudaea sp.]